MLRLTTFASILAAAAALLSACAGDDTSSDDPADYTTSKTPGATVQVALNEFWVKPDVPSAPAGPIRFDATNESISQVHELAVLRVLEDGSFENAGEIEDLAPGTSGTITLDLPAGKYELACVIVPGEAGSQVDHYKAGMLIAFELK